MPTIKIGASNYFYERKGTGDPVLLIAGYTCDHSLWLPFLPLLDSRFEIILVDNRGVGQTKDNGQTLTSTLIADDYADMLKAFSITKAHIVGQSMGGTIAQQIAIRHPSVVKKLMLINTVSKWNPYMLHLLQAMIALREADVDIELQFKILFPLILGKKTLGDPQRLENLKNTILNNPHAQSLNDQKRQVNILREHESEHLLDKIDAKSMIVLSEEDVIIATHDDSKQLAKGIKKSEIAYIPGGHQSLTEATNELALLINQFLLA